MESSPLPSITTAPNMCNSTICKAQIQAAYDKLKDVNHFVRTFTANTENTQVQAERHQQHLKYLTSHMVEMGASWMTLTCRISFWKGGNILCLRFQITCLLSIQSSASVINWQKSIQHRFQENRVSVRQVNPHIFFSCCFECLLISCCDRNQFDFNKVNKFVTKTWHMASCCRINTIFRSSSQLDSIQTTVSSFIIGDFGLIADFLIWIIFFFGITAIH